MNKDQAQQELADILEQKMLHDPGWEETINDGHGFVDSNVIDIIALGNGSWNDELAKRHIEEMRVTLLGS